MLFSLNELGTGDCTALVEAIKRNSTIIQLDLSGNDLGTGDCTALAKAIKKNSTITQLDLSWNDLGTCDCTTLAEAIKHNLTMTVKFVREWLLCCTGGSNQTHFNNNTVEFVTQRTWYW